MNAKQAADKAKQIREDRATATKRLQESRDKKLAADWRKERADFLIEFHRGVEDDIASAVGAGKTSCDIEYLAKIGSARTRVDAENWYESSPLRDLVEDVFAHFRAKGFSIKMQTFTHEHYESYETSNEKYYMYSRGCTISW